MMLPRVSALKTCHRKAAVIRATEGMALLMPNIHNKQNLGKVRQIAGYQKLTEELGSEFLPSGRGACMFALRQDFKKPRLV